MKAKYIKDYVKYCNDVSAGVCEPLPRLPRVTILIAPPLTIQHLPHTLIHLNILKAMEDLGYAIDDSIEEDALFRRLRQLTKEHFKSQKARIQGDNYEGLVPKQFKNDDLFDALKFFLNTVRLYRLESAKIYLECGNQSTTEIGKLVEAWTGKKEDFIVAIVAHFIWQIKRKLNGLKVKNHLMLILYGMQGGGKTEAIKALLEPFFELGLCLASNISQLTDERYLKVLSDHFVCFSDEMGQAEKADINNLKNIITAERLHPRILGKNAAFDIKQNCTFIGASNRSVNEMIFDPTGMRRFIQINCAAPMNWAQINKINYLELIRGVNERNNEGYLTSEILKTLQEAQQKLVSHDDIYHFFDESAYKPCPQKSGNFIPSRDLYSLYTNWIDENGGGFKHSKYEFIKRIKNRGFADDTKKVNGKTTRGFWILSESSMQENIQTVSIVREAK